MKVRCVYNTGSGLLKITIDSGSNKEIVYPLKINEVYIVYGQCIVVRDEKYPILKYLIKGSYEDLPSWYPAELFEVIDSQINFNWYYKYNVNLPIIAIWGYKELVLSENHYDELIEREPAAIRIFLQRKSEIEEFE